MIKTTIVAQATAMVAQPIGIIRLSGPKSLQIAKKITKKDNIKVRSAHFVQLYDQSVVDHAVVIYFKAPHSFTGEDVVEIQMHGNPFLKERVISLCIQNGAVYAKPGEFSERAFINGKMSLDQVEAVADIIHANSLRAAKSASLSLDGALKRQVERLQSELMALRVLIEASIDFSEEDIPTITDGKVSKQLTELKDKIKHLLMSAERGAKLQSGIVVSLVGKPNVGKSTLMNAICQQEVSIVTNEEGTTRDVVSREVIHKGVSITFSDTAGIRETESVAESIGIERSFKAIEGSDLVLYINDVRDAEIPNISASCPVWTVYNKADLYSSIKEDAMNISAKTHQGVVALLDKVIGHFKLGDVSEAPFSARSRQVDILKRVFDVIKHTSASQSFEFIASDLYLMQETLSEITGAVSTDDMLADLFEGFCIGK